MIITADTHLRKVKFNEWLKEQPGVQYFNVLDSKVKKYLGSK